MRIEKDTAQYLLDQVARLTAENAMLKEKWLAQPEQWKPECCICKTTDNEEDNYIEMLPSELWFDGYEAGKKSALLSKQPEQEPVAWMNEWVDEVGEPVKSVVYNFYDDANLIPLYTAPPKRKPFGPEERQRLSKAYSTRAEQVAFEEGIIFAKILYGIGGE